MRSRLPEFFEGADARLSSMRLKSFLVTVAVLATWCFVSAWKSELQALPETVLGLLLGINGLNVWQRISGEKGTAPAAPGEG